MELCMREKAVFFLPVNILTVWSPAFLAARHTTVCLDLIQNSQAVKKVCGPEKGYGRVRNPKNQLLQINPPTIVGCSL